MFRNSGLPISNEIRPAVDLISPFLNLPGLRGFWPMSVINAGGDAVDLSGSARTLTYNGTPTYNYANSIIPYIDLVGAGDWLSRADEAGLDILGTETYVASAVRGLTLGGWFWANSVASQQWLITKYTGGTTGAYRLWVAAGGSLNFGIINSTPAADTVTCPTTLIAGAWHFIVGRFTRSSLLSIYLDGTRTDQASASTAIQNGAESLILGARTTTPEPLAGRISLAFLCADSLSNILIDSLFSQTRLAFGI